MPPFEFGSGPGQLAETVNLAPSSHSPVRLTPPGPPSTGHRRGGSEFIGGDITHGGPVLVSTTPTSAEDTPHPPPSPPKGPPTARRGHAHRRSGAVSQSDVGKIMFQAPDHRGGSAPSTPSEPNFAQKRPSPERWNSHPGPNKSVNGSSRPPSQTTDIASPPSRSRVGFSDTLEYIPRPLSTISSETSSSMSTLRAAHSVNDSITSVVSGPTSSPPSFKEFDNTQMLVPQAHFGRPITSASLTLDRDSLHTMDEESQEVAPSVSSKPRSGSRNLKGAKDHDSAHISDVDSIDPCDPSEESSVPVSNTSASENQFRVTSSEPSLQTLRPRTSPESSHVKRQQKVKSWAESILHRKERNPVVHDGDLIERQSEAPHGDEQDLAFSLDDVNFDDDTTMIIEEPTTAYSKDTPLQQGALDQSFETRGDPSEANTFSPTIDLDAAFNFSGGSTSNTLLVDSAGRLSGSKRRLHSSGEMGDFSGPGGHYRRRAESAPEMEPFDLGVHGAGRSTVNHAVDEAIEEEDEDYDQGEHRPTIAGLGVNVVESEEEGSEPVQRRRATGLNTTSRYRGVGSTPTPPNELAPVPVEIVEAEEEPRFSVLTKSSDDSTVTPTLSRDPLSPRPASAPLDFAVQTPSLTYGSTPETPSAVSSADYTKTTFDPRDVPRLHTAHSSITDRVTLNSSRAGDQSGSSMDDVPSLISSTSTMISGHPMRFSSSSNIASSAERSTSLSAAVPPRTRPGSASKRSSLASLSRLVGGPYNRSRLNIAETLPPDSPEKTEKKKRHRISRVMTFWKSKEKS
ncbi:MAG: hypothetical protein OHK93_007780 [Ramalina farinacea]|uniref:Cell wall proline rich protein n=1 Tax=Ramalina farinacea TaxID=258253 RepID=A0AA43TVV9_9LECA|nr:hypothetical protein [Ramalina farinacea]